MGSEMKKEILKAKKLDAALIYFDELNVANGWYLTGWCGQFEKGSVLVPVEGEPILLGGPESEPFAKMNSAITKVRCFPVFMVPDEEYPNATIMNFKELNDELKAEGTILRRIGFVGTSTIPHQVYCDFMAGFEGVEKAFAIQAGREVRVMVKPEQVNDEGMKLIAREMAAKIQEEMKYPGQIKVHLIRESRVADYAK